MTRDLLEIRHRESERLNKLHSYWRGTQPLPISPDGVPEDVKRMARMSRVNVLPLVIDVPAQALYVSGFRSATQSEDEDVWAIWQANKLDAHQTAVHRAAFAYSTSYVTVLPGDPHAVIRGHSPRQMTAAYTDDDDEWPMVGLRLYLSGKKWIYRLYDDEHVYFLAEEEDGTPVRGQWRPKVLEWREHGMGVCPIVRFRNVEDLDDEALGELDGLLTLQDQMDFTTFDLLVAQHFSAFRQRYILGWTTTDEQQKIKASASRLLTFDDEDVKVGEFGQTDVSGYLKSRESTLEHIATISQTPPHHLLGKLVNLSAEALVAAEAGQRRKLEERAINFGEAWEQALRLAGASEGIDVDDDAQVRWRDTEARALAATVDALGKMAQMLGVPVQVLWEKIPGWTQQDVESAKAAAASGDALAQLTSMLDAQMGATPVPPV